MLSLPKNCLKSNLYVCVLIKKKRLCIGVITEILLMLFLLLLLLLLLFCFYFLIENHQTKALC